MMSVARDLEVDVVLIDLDNTIYRFNEASQYARERLSEHIANFTNISADVVLKAYAEIADRTEGGAFASGHVMRCHRFEALAQKLGISIDAERMARFLEEQLLDHAYLYRGADVALASLERNYSIVIMTEAHADIKRQILKRLRLERSPLFATFQYSGRKSNGSGYEAIARKLNVDTNKMIMVGDSWQNDVLAAAKCNMATIWISHGRSIPGPPPLRFIGSAQCLLDALPLFGLSSDVADE